MASDPASDNGRYLDFPHLQASSHAWTDRPFQPPPQAHRSSQAGIWHSARTVWYSRKLSAEDPMSERTKSTTRTDAFAQKADEREPNVLRNFWDLLKHTKKWWLVPIIAVLLIIGLLIIIGGTAAAPFIYSLF